MAIQVRFEQRPPFYVLKQNKISRAQFTGCVAFACYQEEMEDHKYVISAIFSPPDD